MKRSEMIKKLRNYMYPMFQNEFRDHQVDAILFFLEKAGMLPPFNPEIEESKLGYGAAYLDDTSVREGYCNHFCKWEPEDV